MIRFAIRWSLRLLTAALLLAVAAILFRDYLLRDWIAGRIERLTGLETHLGGVRTDLSRACLTLTNLQVVNSREFGGTPMLTLPELHLELDTRALARGELRLILARLRLTEFNVVRNQAGHTNIFAILDSVNDHATVVDGAVAAPANLAFTGIETLDLSMGTARFQDLGQPGHNQEFRVCLTNEILHNVKSATDFSPLVMRVLLREISSGFGRGQFVPKLH